MVVHARSGSFVLGGADGCVAFSLLLLLSIIVFRGRCALGNASAPSHKPNSELKSRTQAGCLLFPSDNLIACLDSFKTIINVAIKLIPTRIPKPI